MPNRTRDFTARRRTKPAYLVHPDVPALLSLGLQATYVLGLRTYRLHEQGWPSWLKAVLPDWAPGPVGVLYLMPALSIFAAGVSLLWTDRRYFRRGTGITSTPLVCYIAAIGSIVLWLQLFWQMRWHLSELPWLLLMCLATLPMLPFADRPFRRFRRRRARRCERCGSDGVGQSVSCDACGSSYTPRAPAEQVSVHAIATAAALLSSLIVAIPVMAYHILRAANGIRMIQLYDASRRVDSGSVASHFVEPGLLLADVVPKVAWVVAAYSFAILGTAINRKDGHAGPLTAIAAVLSILFGLVAHGTGLTIRG